MRRRFLALLPAVCTSLACTDIGLGVPGTGTPLPAGGLPASQTVEGGAQIRVSQAGFTKLTSVVPGLLDDAIEGTLCIPRGSFSTADYCYTNQGGCTQGCAVAIDVEAPQFTISVTNQQTVQVHFMLAPISASVPVDGEILFIPFSCTLTLGFASPSVDADIALSIDPATGVLVANLASLDTLGLGTPTVSGCGVAAPLIDGIVDGVVDALQTALIVDVIAPALEAVIAELFPAPQELAALVDLPALAITGPGSSNGSAVETRLSPGGYVQLNGNGLSLGVVAGFNSDADAATRAPSSVSEPHPCVPALVAPDLSQPPALLAQTSRNSFALPPAGAFLGMPEPASDLLVGISRTALDLMGHHVVASGGLCLTVDASRAAFVHRDALDDVLGVPLGPSDEALRLVLKPQQGLRFEIGDGLGSPQLTAVLDDLRIDVDALPAGTPLLRLDADVRLGLDLVLRHDAGLPPRLEATRASLDVVDAGAAAFDDRYAGLDAGVLDPLASTLADVVFSTLGADAGLVSLGGFSGFGLDNVAVSRVLTSSDEFLAVSALLGAPTPSAEPPAPTPLPLSTTLVLPTPAALRAALVAGTEGGLPTVHVELHATDGARALEHAWRTAGGAWRPWVATDELVIRDRSFAWQGARTIELRSRVVGDAATTSPTGSTTVSIDWAPPAVFAEQAHVAEFLVVPARDASGGALEWAVGRVGESEPATAWSSDPNLDSGDAWALGDEVVVYVRDASGNVGQATVNLLPEPDATAAALLALAALRSRLARRRRQPRRA